MKSAAVAPGDKPNTFRLLRLRVCAMRFAPLPAPGNEEPPVRTGFDDVLRGLSFEVLQEGYVILIQTGTSDSSLAPVAENATLARTTANGELVWIDQKEIGGEPPTDASRTMFFDRGSRYAMFWTKVPGLAKTVWQDVQSDSAKAIDDHPFGHLWLTARGTPRRPRELWVEPGNDLKLDVLLHDTFGRAADVPVHGIYPGRLLQPQCEDCDPSASYVLARSDSLSALYVTELLSRASMHQQLANFEDWMTMDAVRDVARHAREKLRPKELDAGLVPPNADPRERDLQEKYFEYAYECASKKVPRDLFWSALKVFVSQSGWTEAAKTIKRDYGTDLDHPSLENDWFNPLRKPLQEPLMAYFNFYSFGFRHDSPEWDRHARAAQAKIVERAAQLRARRCDFVARRLKYARVLQELVAHYRGDERLQAGIHEHFHHAALQNDYAWWNDFAVEDEAFWGKLKGYADVAGTIFDKVGELLSQIFEDKDTVNAINSLLQESIPALEKLFKRMHAFNHRFRGETVERKLADNLTIEADFGRGELVIRQTGKEDLRVGGIKFLVEEDLVEHTVMEKQPRRKRSAMKRRFKQIKKVKRVHTVRVPEMPFREVQRWPAFMAAFGDSVALTLTILEFRTRLKEDPESLTWDIYGKLAQDTFQVVGSISAVIELVKFAKITNLPWALRVGGRIGAAGHVIEAAFNVRESYILFLVDGESAIERALERGESIEAYVHRARGVVLLMSAGAVIPGAVLGAKAAVAAGGSVAAGAATVALAWLGVGLAVAALLTLGFDGYLYLHRGPDDVTDKLAGKLEEALDNEFGDDERPGPSRTERQLAQWATAADELMDMIQR